MKKGKNIITNSTNPSASFRHPPEPQPTFESEFTIQFQHQKQKRHNEQVMEAFRRDVEAEKMFLPRFTSNDRTNGAPPRYRAPYAVPDEKYESDMEEAQAMIRQMREYSNKIKTMVEGIKQNLGQARKDQEKKEMQEFYHQQMDEPKEEVWSETEKTEIADVDLVLQRDVQQHVAVAQIQQLHQRFEAQINEIDEESQALQQQNYESESGYATSVQEFAKKINDVKNQYVIFSEADPGEFLPNFSDGFGKLRYLPEGTQTGGFSCFTVQRERVPKKIRAKRGILEQNFAELGLDPADTVSYFSRSPYLQQLVRDHRDALRWQVSSVPNPNMLDIQFVANEGQLPLSQAKIETPEVFQNQFIGVSFSLQQIMYDKQQDLSFARLPNKDYLNYQAPFSGQRSLVLVKQPVLITKLLPIKAFTTRANFFQIDDEIMTESQLQQALATSKHTKSRVYFEASPKFSLKILETVRDVLDRLQLKASEASELESLLQFQTLDLLFVINTHTGRPELCGLQSSCFESNTMVIDEPTPQRQQFAYKPCDRIVPAKQYQQCMLTLLLKMDKKVREFNGLKQNMKYSKRHFTTLWQRVMDEDKTELDMRYDCPYGKEKKDVYAGFQEVNVFHLDKDDIQGQRVQQFDNTFWRHREEDKSEFNETQLDINALYNDQDRAERKQLQKQYQHVSASETESQGQVFRRSRASSSMQSRKYLPTPTEYDDDEPILAEDAQVKAVVKIQALARMLQQRRIYRNQIQAAVTIQVIYVHILKNRSVKRGRKQTLHLYQLIRSALLGSKREGFKRIHERAEEAKPAPARENATQTPGLQTPKKIEKQKSRQKKKPINMTVSIQIEDDDRRKSGKKSKSYTRHNKHDNRAILDNSRSSRRRSEIEADGSKSTSQKNHEFVIRLKDSESPSSSKGPLTSKSFVENDITHEASVESGVDEQAPTQQKEEKGGSMRNSAAGGQSATSIQTNLRNADAVEDQDSVVDHRSLRQVAAGDTKTSEQDKKKATADESSKISDNYSTSNMEHEKRDEMTKTMYKGSQKVQTGRETPNGEQDAGAAAKPKKKQMEGNHIKVRDHEEGKKDDQLQMFQDFGSSKPAQQLAKELRDSQVKQYAQTQQFNSEYQEEDKQKAKENFAKMVSGQTNYSQVSQPSRPDSNMDSHNKTINFQDMRHISKVSGRSTVSPFIPQQNALLSPSPAQEQSLDSTRLHKNYAKYENDYSISEVSGQREEDHATPVKGSKPHKIIKSNQDIADVHPSMHGEGVQVSKKHQAHSKPVFKSNDFQMQQQAGVWRQHGYPDYPGQAQAYSQRQFEAIPNYPQPGVSYQGESTSHSLKQGPPEYGYLQTLAQPALGESQNSMFSYGSYQLSPQLPPQFQQQPVSQSMQMPSGSYNAYLRQMINEDVERMERQQRIRGIGPPSKQPRQKGPVTGLPTNTVHRRNRADQSARSLNAEQMRRRARQMSQRHHNLTVQPRVNQAHHSAARRRPEERDLFLPSIVSQPRGFQTIDDETEFIKNFLVNNGKAYKQAKDLDSPARLPKGIYKQQKSTRHSQYQTAASQLHASGAPLDPGLRSHYDPYLPPSYIPFQMVPNLHLNASPYDLNQYRRSGYSPGSGTNASPRTTQYNEQNHNRK